MLDLPGICLGRFPLRHSSNETSCSPAGRAKSEPTNLCQPLPPVAFPDVAELVVEAAAGGAKSLIIDAELVAVDRENGNRLKAFQASDAPLSLHVGVI